MQLVGGGGRMRGMSVWEGWLEYYGLTALVEDEVNGTVQQSTLSRGTFGRPG